MISKEHINHLALLARLRIEEKDVKKFQKDVEDIIAYMDTLREADVSGVKPASHITGLENTTREDKPGPTASYTRDVLKEVPQKKGRLVRVPLILKFKSQNTKPQSKSEKL
jgi:aspartyl/glutamyl-tRNA(Asn/Gln) amidotransferase C subunit